jgi:thymidine kinase
MPARLELIMGCMFSGKSTELIRRLKRYRALDKSILVINSAKDIRSDQQVIQTHDKNTFECVKTDDLSTLGIQNHQVIAIDEAQFFTGLREFVERSLAKGKHIIVAGLDGDFEQKKFGELVDLIPLCDDVLKLHALCMKCADGTPAPFTRRLVDSREQELVGDSLMYIATCRKCLNSS